MGKLTTIRQVIGWVISLAIVVGSVTFIHPQLQILANVPADKLDSAPSVKSVDGHSQIVGRIRGQEQHLSEVSNNQHMPHADGEYVVWSEADDFGQQIIRYHVPSKTSLQLTFIGTNQLPQVNKEGQVIWQEWADEKWQVVWFDGTSVSKISSGSVAYQPVWYRRSIYFSQRSDIGEWVLQMFNPEARVLTTVSALDYPLLNTKASLASRVTPIMPTFDMPEQPQQTVTDAEPEEIVEEGQIEITEENTEIVEDQQSEEDLTEEVQEETMPQEQIIEIEPEATSSGDATLDLSTE